MSGNGPVSAKPTRAPTSHSATGMLRYILLNITCWPRSRDVGRQMGVSVAGVIMPPGESAYSQGGLKGYEHHGISHRSHTHMSRPEKFPFKLQFSITEGMDAAIDHWRRRQKDQPNRSEAIRRLVEAGLSAIQPKQQRSFEEICSDRQKSKG